MALVVNTNVSSLAAQRNLSINQAQLGRSVERLSSGLRITRAADDAAGLGVSETLRAQIRSINQANRNAGDGISLTQVADGAAATVGSLLSRMRELATQSASGTLGATERSYLDQEFVALRSEIDRIATTTEYNGQPLLSGSSNTFEVFIGFKSGSGRSRRRGGRIDRCECVDGGSRTDHAFQYRQRHQRGGNRPRELRVDSKPVRSRDPELDGHG